MKLREVFEITEEKDYDVCNTYTDEIFPCISLPQRGLTEAGKERFVHALDLEVTIESSEPGWYSEYIIVKVANNQQLNELRSFCYAQAGYIPEEDYAKWFQEDRDEE